MIKIKKKNSKAITSPIKQPFQKQFKYIKNQEKSSKSAKRKMKKEILHQKSASKIHYTTAKQPKLNYVFTIRRKELGSLSQKHSSKSSKTQTLKSKSSSKNLSKRQKSSGKKKKVQQYSKNSAGKKFKNKNFIFNKNQQPNDEYYGKKQQFICAANTQQTLNQSRAFYNKYSRLLSRVKSLESYHGKQYFSFKERIQEHELKRLNKMQSLQKIKAENQLMSLIQKT